jgi:hypothetical protein
LIGLLLTRKQATEPKISIGYVEVITSKFYGRYHDLVTRYLISVSQMTTGMFRLS